MSEWQAFAWTITRNPDGTLFMVCQNAPIVCQVESQQLTELDVEHLDHLVEMYLDSQ